MNILLVWDSRLLLLNEIKDNSIYQPEGKTVPILLFAARSTIAQYWKQNTTPPLTTWHQKIWTYWYYRIVRITDGTLQHADEEEANNRFSAFWLPIMTYLSHLEDIPDVL